MDTNTLKQHQQQAYQQRLVVNRLRRELYQQPDPTLVADLFQELKTAEQVLATVEVSLASSPKHNANPGLIVDSGSQSGAISSPPSPGVSRGGGRGGVSRGGGGSRGQDTTGLEVKVHLCMAHVPTAYYHLLNPKDSPLISCQVTTTKNLTATKQARRVRVSSFIEGYSAKAVNTFELTSDQPHTFDQLPTLFHDRIHDLRELTRATLNILVEDLDGAVELHQTYPLWLLARTTAPLQMLNPKTGQPQDMTPYLAAFVTPNAPSLMKFLYSAAQRHPNKRLVGYQKGDLGVESQVRALFEALKEETQITYVHSVIDFNPAQGFDSQRVRLPRESLADKQANCIDGTVLFASLLEGISLNPAIVIAPGHAFVAWETKPNSNNWQYLETTLIAQKSFAEACAFAQNFVTHYKNDLKLYALQQLRTENKITPME